MDVPKLSDEPNPGIKLVCDELPYIPNPSQLIELEDPIKLTTFVLPFQNDYFVYWGSVRTNACKHVLLWILCRQPYAVSEKQLEIFRTLFTSGHQPIVNNARNVHNQGYEVFHINPSAYSDDVLYKKTENNICKKVLTLEKMKGMKKHRSSHGGYLMKSKQSSNTSLNAEGGIQNNDEPIKNELMTKHKTISNASLNSYNDKQKGLSEGTKQQSEKISLKELVKKTSETSSLKISSKPKRQSYYRKFFSRQNKIDKKENEKFLHFPKQGDVTMIPTSSNTETVFPNKLRDTIALQNKYEIYNTKKEVNKKEESHLKQLKSQYNEAKSKFKNDDNNGKERKEPNINALKYINKPSMSKLQINDYTPIPERSSKVRCSHSVEDERGNLGVIKESSIENWKKLKNDSKGVSINSKLNLSATAVSKTIICNNQNNPLGFKECESQNQQTKTLKKIKNNPEKSHPRVSNELDNNSHKVSCDEMNDSNNINDNGIKNSNSLSSNKDVQEIGINTMSLSELITALTAQQNHEAKKMHKLLNASSITNLTLSSGGSSSGDFCYKNENDKTEYLQKTVKAYKKEKSKKNEKENIKKNKKSQAIQKSVSEKSNPSQKFGAKSKSDSSARSMKEKRSKHVFYHDSVDSMGSSNSSKDFTQETPLKQKSKEKSVTLPRLTEHKPSYNSHSKERIKDGERLTRKSQSKSQIGNKLLDEYISGIKTNSCLSSRNSKRSNSRKSVKCEPSKSSERFSKSREHDLHSQHSLQSQPSVRSSEKRHSSNESSHHSDNENNSTFKKFSNRPLTPTPDIHNEIEKFRKRNIISSINKTLNKRYVLNTSSDESETASTSTLARNPSIQIRMSKKYEKEMRNKVIAGGTNKFNPTKLFGRNSKILDFKDCTKIMKNTKEASKIPLRKSTLKKQYDTDTTTDKTTRPQSVSCSRDNDTRSKLIRPKTIDSELNNEVTTEPCECPSVTIGLKKSDDNNKNTFRMKVFQSKIPARRPTARTWKY